MKKEREDKGKSGININNVHILQTLANLGKDIVDLKENSYESHNMHNKHSPFFNRSLTRPINKIPFSVIK